MKNAIAGAYGAAIALFVTVSHDLLFKDVMKWPESASLTGAIAVGVLLLIFYEIVSGSKTVTRFFSPLSKVAGAWKITLITNNDERPTSVCQINFANRNYVYSGYGINCDGTLGATWTSRDVHYDEELDELSFTSDSTIMKNGKRVRNYGYIKFSKNASGRFEYGNGYFVDMTDQLTQSHITLVKIKDSEFDNIVKGSFERTKAIGGPAV